MSDHLRRLDTAGFTVLADAVPEDLCAALSADIASINAARGDLPSGTWFEGHRTVLIRNLLAHSTSARQIPGHPGILPVVESLLGPGCLLSSIASRTVLPDEVGQVFHADDIGIDLPRPHPALECTAMLALTDFTASNGATRVVPGSHRRTTVPRLSETSPRDLPDAVSIEMAAGSVLLYHAGVWHAAGANTTDTPRVGVGVSYCRGWIRAHENPYLGLPVELARTFDDRLRGLCGYAMYRRVINHVDGMEPLAYLERQGLTQSTTDWPVRKT